MRARTQVPQDGEQTVISDKRESGTLQYLRRKTEGPLIPNDNFAFSLQKRKNYGISLVSGVRFCQLRCDFGQQ
jgi:hypothetical protein